MKKVPILLTAVQKDYDHLDWLYKNAPLVFKFAGGAYNHAAYRQLGNILKLFKECAFFGIDFSKENENKYLGMLFYFALNRVEDLGIPEQYAEINYPAINKLDLSEYHAPPMAGINPSNRRSHYYILEQVLKMIRINVELNLKHLIKEIENSVYESIDPHYLADLARVLDRSLINHELHPEFKKIPKHVKTQLTYLNRVKDTESPNAINQSLTSDHLNVSNDTTEHLREHTITSKPVENEINYCNTETHDTKIVKHLKPLSGWLYGKVIMNEADYKRLIKYVEVLVKDSSIPIEIKAIAQTGAPNDLILRTFYNLYIDLYARGKDSERRQRWCEFIKATFSQFREWEISTISSKLSATNLKYDSIVKLIMYGQ